jgi:hypothetical protein
VLFLAIDPTEAARLHVVTTDLPVSLLSATAVILAIRAFQRWQWKDLAACAIAPDQKDAEWIAQLLQYGLLRPSYISCEIIRDLRDLTRTYQDRNSVSQNERLAARWAQV